MSLRSKYGNLYDIWLQMKARTTNPKHPAYGDYGARGIAVCEEWALSFEKFASDMGKRPPGTSLERKDNSVGYCATNCFWATRMQQANNKRSNVIVLAFGRSQTIAQRACETGLKRTCIVSRLKSGWSPDRALSTPSRLRRLQSEIIFQAHCL